MLTRNPRLLSCVSSLIAFAGVAVSGTALGKEKCYRISAEQDMVITSPTTTEGTMSKDRLLKGTTQFQLTGGFAPTPDPNVLSYAGEMTITTKRGVLLAENVGLLDSVNGVLTDIAYVKGGTGIFEGARGILFSRGQSTDGIKFEDIFSGKLCLQK